MQNVKNPKQRSPYAMKFEDRFHEERENDNSDVLEVRLGILIKTNSRSKKKDKVTFQFPAEESVLLAASTKKPTDREFVFDSGSNMHRVSSRDGF